jgi:hypothetical protein
MLGTNLSVKHDEGMFSSESERLVLMDFRDFNSLGLGLDDLIEAYVQTVLAGEGLMMTWVAVMVRLVPCRPLIQPFKTLASAYRPSDDMIRLGCAGSEGSTPVA